MSKYINADKLIAEIERQNVDKKVIEPLIRIIDSLQQEQPEADLEKEIKNYLATKCAGDDEPSVSEIARHFYELGLNVRKEELPEIELDKFTDKVDIFKARYKHPEIVSIKGAMAFMARMFYQYPNVARLWYDSLPKATMD